MTEQLLQGAPATLSVELLDQHGELAAPSGTVTVAVSRADGSVVLAAGTATSADGAARTVALSAAQTASLDVLTATWSDDAAVRASTTHEVAGGFYFSVSAARVSDPSLVDEARYTNGEVRQRRAEVEEEFERILGYALVPRYARERLYSSSPILRLPQAYLRRVVAVRAHTSPTTYDDLVVADLAVAANDAGLAIRQDEQAWGDVTVAYEHGLDAPPADLLAAALTRVRYRLNTARSGIPDRAERYQSETGGTYVLSMPGAFKTGQPDVDAVLAARHLRVPVG